jgi:hypothetical protein
MELSHVWNTLFHRTKCHHPIKLIVIVQRISFSIEIYVSILREFVLVIAAWDEHPYFIKQNTKCPLEFQNYHCPLDMTAIIVS